MSLATRKFSRALTFSPVFVAIQGCAIPECIDDPTHAYIFLQEGVVSHLDFTLNFKAKVLPSRHSHKWKTHFTCLQKLILSYEKLCTIS